MKKPEVAKAYRVKTGRGFCADANEDALTYLDLLPVAMSDRIQE